MNATREFSLRDILTVTTGRLLTKSNGPNDNGIGNLYEILGWMVGRDPYTHQLGRFGEECKPWLLRWFPELATADVFLPDLDKGLEGGRAGNFDHRKMDFIVEGWMIRVMADTRCKASYDVPKIPQDHHATIDPYDEMAMQQGTDEGIMILGV